MVKKISWLYFSMKLMGQFEQQSDNKNLIYLSNITKRECCYTEYHH